MAWQLSHVVNNSWLPISMSMVSFLMMVNTLFWFKFGLSIMFLSLSTMSVACSFFLWFRDVTRESSYQGNHTFIVQGGLKWGLVWFLFSEVWFFFSVFWTFFHVSIAPLSGAILTWPYLGLEIILPFQVPLLNTLILLMSGMTATLAHQELMSSKKTNWLFVSMILGFYFLMLQGVEYYAASFSLSAGTYGSIFFFGTGFHGLHVCLGATMLAVSTARSSTNLISSSHHFGVEFSLWYWHFVDVVWLFLFFFVYTWGS